MSRYAGSRWLGGLGAVVLALASAAGAARDPASSPSAVGASGRTAPVVYGAASLTDALAELGAAYAKSTGFAPRYSFAASSTLARQIENGAPADVFFSADRQWMDYLENRKLLAPGSRHDVLGNSLVLVAPVDSTLHLKIAHGFALKNALGGGRLALGDPDSVPAGRYARAALESLGVWDAVAEHMVRAENVRAALAFVERGEVPLGIVYKTDALIDPGVRTVDEFPADSHPPITYPLALTAGAKSGAAEFAAFLRTPAAGAVFARYGFVPLR